MSKQMLATRTTSLIEPSELIPAHEEAGVPLPAGAVCKNCLSNDLVQSRRPGLFALAKLFGYKVYRCRQCMRRTAW